MILSYNFIQSAIQTKKMADAMKKKTELLRLGVQKNQ